MQPTSIPVISVSLAPPADPTVEPYSPFSRVSFPVPDTGDYRPYHLTPPPTVLTFNIPNDQQPKKASTGQGLEREHFLALLKSSCQRKSPPAKAVDLRKEVALKAHRNGQAERRALFLLKVQASSSPLIQKTTQKSPSCSLPSECLVPPLALFDLLKHGSIHHPSVDPWAEHQNDVLFTAETMDFTRASYKQKMLPSLEQISARLKAQRAAAIEKDDNLNPTHFQLEVTDYDAQDGILRDGAPISGARLCMPSPPYVSPVPEFPISVSTPSIHATTTRVTSKHSENVPDNLHVPAFRQRCAHKMLSTLKRRTLSSEYRMQAAAVLEMVGEEEEPRTRWKRHSAPPDMLPLRPRTGFEHAVLLQAGGF